MPYYEYKVGNREKGCAYCRRGFEFKQSMEDPPIKKCPKCSSNVRRVFSTFSVGFSKTGFDKKAKEKGFHKLKRRDKGTYEKLY